jgi:hypothetical protein
MPPEEPPEGCFWLTTGRPIDPAQLERIRAQGRESLCEFFLGNGLNEQSRYKLFRCFFPISFREFRTLERRVASVGETCTVFVPLLDESTAVWRPVSAVRVGGGSTISGRSKEVGAWCAGNPFESKRNPGTSTIGCGAALVDRARSTTSSCCTSTATGRSTQAGETDGMISRPVRDVVKGLSRMKREFHVRFRRSRRGSATQMPRPFCARPRRWSMAGQPRSSRESALRWLRCPNCRSTR